MTAVSIHEKGKEHFKKSKLIEKAMAVPLEPGYAYHYINCDKAYEYHQYLRDLLRNDDEYRERAVNQLLKNIDYLIDLSVTLVNKTEKEVEEGRLKHKYDDQLDAFFNLLHHIIEENSRLRNDKVIEKSVCSQKMSEKLLQLMRVPSVADAIAKETMVYKEVFKSFITEYPKLLERVHEDLAEGLDQVEKILGPLKDSEDFLPMHKDMETQKEKKVKEQVTVWDIVSIDYIETDDEKLRVLYCIIKNYCNIIRCSNRRFDSFLGLDISKTIRRLVALRRAIIIGGSDLYEIRLFEMYKTHKDSMIEFDKKIEAENLNEDRDESDEEKNDEIIGTLTRKEYMNKFKVVSSNNYATANFIGVLDCERENLSEIEKEAEQCQTEIHKLVQLWWKKKIPSSSSKTANNVEAIVDSTIFMSTILEPKNLLKVIDPNNIDEENMNIYKIMASFAKFNQVIEEYTRLMSSDSPYMTNFYMKKGFKNIFSLYHWMREITPLFEKQKIKRILFSKHIQLLWSNIGDHFATVVECKFCKESRDPISLQTEKHKTNKDFICSLFYHICSEIFKQKDIITFYLQHSKFFLECMIDIMKLLITEETFTSLPILIEQRQHIERRGRHRPAQMEFEDEVIAVVTNMGFSRTIAIRALQRTYGNVEAAIELLLGGNLQEDDEEINEEHKELPPHGEDMDEEEVIKEEEKEDKMEIDDGEIKVVNYDELNIAIKEWLKMLFNWILTGYNSTLTDLDVENITQFMLKYVSSDEEVEALMTTCIDVMKNMEGYLIGDDGKDIMDYYYQRDRKGSLKKIATLTKILANLEKYFIKNVDFFESITTYFVDLIAKANQKPLKFIPKEKEFQIGDLTDVEPSKSEYEIFKDIVDNCMNIVIAGYGVFKLSKSTKVALEVEKESDSLMKKINEEEKKEESKEDDSKNKKEEESSFYPSKITKYLKNNDVLADLELIKTEEILKNWSLKFSEDFFLNVAMKIIEHSSDNFDQLLSEDSFKKLMYYL